MRGILLISHGQYAEAFKGSLKMIAAKLQICIPAACCQQTAQSSSRKS